MSRDSLRRFWRGLTGKNRQFVVHAAVALITLIALNVLNQSHWLQRLENSAIDTMMEFNKGLPRMSGEAQRPPLLFAFLDIDESSFYRWNEPYHTPRDKLLELIDYAAGAAPSLIVVDIDLAKAGIYPDHDARLVDYLSNYEASPSPPLILVRSFYSASAGDGRWREIKPSILDGVSLPASIHWGQPLYQATLWDGVVRHWNLARVGCRNGEPQLVPSIQLVAATLLPNRFKTNRIANIEPLSLDACRPVASREPNAEHEPEFAFETGIEQRLIYTIPWQGPAPDMVTIPAHVVTDSATAVAAELLRDRVVVIGASFADSNDIHSTPIGDMPGALIVINAIKSLAVLGQLREPPIWVTFLLQLALVLLAAWMFSRFDSFLALCMTAAIVIVALMPLSFYLMKYGVWVGFSIPLLAMLIQRGYSEYRDVSRRLRDASKNNNR